MRVVAPPGEARPPPGRKVGEYSTETGEYRAASEEGEEREPSRHAEEQREEERRGDQELSAETLADPGLG